MMTYLEAENDDNDDDDVPATDEEQLSPAVYKTCAEYLSLQWYAYNTQFYKSRTTD
jgi:hypothetical protein